MVTQSNAALSASTANTIEGTAPYLTFDGGVTRATNTDELLGIKLSDGRGYNKLSNTSSVLSPIELPEVGEAFSDIQTLIPATLASVNLSTLIAAPYNYWGDDDGDGQGLGGITATGTLRVSLRDINNNTVRLSDTLEACHAPYTLTLSTTDGELSTAYGAPNTTSFTASSETYYIKPKIDVPPYTCWAKPNLNYDYGGTQPEWDGTKGFKVQDVGIASSNFPRTGFDGAFFDMTVAGTTAANVISATGSPITQGGVTVTLTVTSPYVVRVMLTGPNYTTSGGEFTPSTFTIKSSATNDIYSFALSKWFIAKPGVGEVYAAAPTFCSDLTGGYRVPSVSEYTNANGNTWTGGLSGWADNSYVRAIGNGKQKTAIAVDDSKGGLFAEWGYVHYGYYTTSDWEVDGDGYWYWAVDALDISNQYYVRAFMGYVYYAGPSNSTRSVVCVSP